MPEHAPTILLVEDDDAVRDTISELLADGGFQVATAATGLEALALIEDRQFDIVVADIRLPGGLSGLEMAQHARLRQPALKCLFISGRSEPVVGNRDLDEFIAKPFRDAELIGCIWKVLRGNFPRPRLDVAR